MEHKGKAAHIDKHREIRLPCKCSRNQLVKYDKLIAQNRGRVLVTMDKDFSNILVYPSAEHHGMANGKNR
jgi:hypothetical protein